MLGEGLPPGFLHTPILFIVEPFAHARANSSVQADKILANCYAFRAECLHLQKRRAVKYCFHIGLANTQGAILDKMDDITTVLGTSIYLFEKHWSQIKPRFVDTVDTQVFDARYPGNDTPEDWLRRFPVPRRRTATEVAPVPAGATTSPTGGRLHPAESTA